MQDFFISYNRADRDWAAWIAWQLEAAGYTTRLQDWDFRPGANFVGEMDRSTKETERTIAVLSPEYLASAFTASEWHDAFRRDPTGENGLLLPVRVRETERTGLIASIVYIDLVGLDAQAARERLLAGVKQERFRPSVEPHFPGIAEPKFPGQGTGLSRKSWLKRIWEAIQSVWGSLSDIAKVLAALAALITAVGGILTFMQANGIPPFDDDAEETPVSTTEVGPLLYRDDFEAIGSFDRISETSTSASTGDVITYFADYRNGNWVMWSPDDFEPNTIRSLVPVNPIADAVIDVDARVVSGDEGAFVAIVCRFNRDTAERYQFSLDPLRGTYRLHRSDYNPETDSSSSTELVQWTESQEIHRGNAWNHVRLECTGNSIRASINGVQVASVTDDHHAEGYPALFAGRFGTATGPFETRFDNLEVYSTVQSATGRPISSRDRITGSNRSALDGDSGA